MRLHRLSLVLVLLVAATNSALASGAHSRVAPRATKNAPNAFANREKLDRELARRSAGGSNETTGVIVTFVDGELPQAFKPFVKDARSRLGIINGYAIDIPNRLLATLAANPN